MMNFNEHEISTAYKPKMLKNKTFLALKLANLVFKMLINVKMPFWYFIISGYDEFQAQLS